MSEIASLVSTLGFPIAVALALGYGFYRVANVCGTLLLDQFQQKDVRLAALEQRVERINNGQREALENRLDVSIAQAKESTEALDKVSACLDRLGTAFSCFATNRPCLHDSDVVLIKNESGDEITPDAKTMERIKRRRDRTETVEG